MLHTAMTARERMLAALAGKTVDRVPAGPLACHSCAPLVGASLRQYSLSAETLAAAVIRYAERFEPDAVWISADTWVTAEAMGANVTAEREDQPVAGSGIPRVRTPADAESIPPPDPHRAGRYPLMLDATRRVREALGDGVFLVACFDQYPFSAACALMGIERAMTAAIEQDQGLLYQVMQEVADYAVAYGEALVEAGADMLSGGDSPAGLLGPRLHAEVAAPFEQELVERLRTATGKPVSLHICGDTTSLLPAMARTGADILELDHRVDMAAAARIVGPGITLWGNLEPVGLLLRGTPEEVAAATERLLRGMETAGHRRFVLSSGCTLSVGTPAENLDAMFAALRT